jgi:protein SCO1/2
MKSTITSAAIIFAALFFLPACGNQSSENKEEKTAAGHTTHATYQCPMKCEGDKTYDQPGSCPVCHMDLKMVEDTLKHHHPDTTHENH